MRLGLRAKSQKSASRFPGSALGNAAAGYLSSPASQANQTSKSSGKTDSSFWDDFGKVGENNTVYNMDQGNSDIGQLNEKTKTLDKPLMTTAPVSNGSTGELTGDALAQRKAQIERQIQREVWGQERNELFGEDGPQLIAVAAGGSSARVPARGTSAGFEMVRNGNWDGALNVAADPAGVLGEVPSIYGMLDEMKAAKNQELINQVKTRIDGMRQSMIDQGMQDVPDYVRTIGKGGVAGIDYQATMDNLSQAYEGRVRDQRLREMWGNDYQNVRVGKSRMTVLEFEQRVLDLHQETANKAYDDGVSLMAQGKLPYKEGEYAKVLGSYIDDQVRTDLRRFAKAEGIPDGGPSNLWAINRRLKTDVLPEYGIPDSRIGRNLYADTTLARKGTYTEQIQKWNTLRPGHTIIIRPEQLPGPLPGSSGSYVIPRALIPQYVPVAPKQPLPQKGGGRV